MHFIKSIFSLIKYIIYFPLILPSLIIYVLSLCDKRPLIEDLEVNYTRFYQKPKRSNVAALYRLMADSPTFRTIFYYRSKPYSALFKFLLRGNSTLFLFVDSLGGGIYVQHGWSTVINAQKIGRNFFVNQNVTVGWRTDAGNPIIGDNVRIGTGATVLGKITIGDNVNIAAGAHVIKDVPSNSTIIPSPSIIARLDGKTIRQPL